MLNFKFLIDLAMNLIKSKGVPAATAELTAVISAENTRVSAGLTADNINVTVTSLVTLATAELTVGLNALAVHLGK